MKPTSPTENLTDEEVSLLDHLHLPESDGTFVKNFQEHPQCILLTDSLGPVLKQLYPDGQYCIGQDSGIYWRPPKRLEQPTRASVSPDWYLVPGRPPLLDGEFRRSYVMWQELLAPLIVIELASEDGSEERDATPQTGKFWIYENVIRPCYYAIYTVFEKRLEVYKYNSGGYTPMTPNQRGRYSIAKLNVELGLWRGSYQNTEMTWLRWWDVNGVLLQTGEERAETAVRERQQALDLVATERQEKQQAQAEVERLLARLKEAGIQP